MHIGLLSGEGMGQKHQLLFNLLYPCMAATNVGHSKILKWFMFLSVFHELKTERR